MNFMGVKKKPKFKMNIFVAYYVKNKNKRPSHYVIGDLVLFNITFNIAKYSLPQLFVILSKSMAVGPLMKFLREDLKCCYPKLIQSTST